MWQGLDDITGEPLTQREDDTPQAIRSRLNIYSQKVSPLLEYYGKNGKVYLPFESVDVGDGVHRLIQVSV